MIRMSSGFDIWSVYVMAAPDKASLTYFKIGRTSDICKRIPGVQTGCPLKITKVWVITVWGNGASQSLELGLHEMLKKYHSHGEWFAMDTSNETHKAAMNEAFAYGVRFASQPAETRWRFMDVAELREAVAGFQFERSKEARKARKTVANRALSNIVLSGRKIL